MARELKIPHLEMDMEEVTIIQWLVGEGDEVSKGDPVLEIETDKTSFKIESKGDGTIHNLRGEEGQSVPVGAVLAYITAPGEEVPENEDEELQEAEEQEATKESGEFQTREEEPSGPGRPGTSPKKSAAPDVDGGQVRASPAARQAAAERDLRLEDVPGSGPRGRVYLSDVVQTDGKVEEERGAPEEAEAVPEPVPERSSREQLSRVRRVAAERTAKSFAEVPYFYLTRDLEVDRLLELSKRLKEKMDPAPTITDLMGLAAVRILTDHPRLNARYVGDALEYNSQVNLGIAVATEEGLLVPVLNGADTLLLRDLVVRSRELTRKAREGKLTLEELSGGTFTVSNLGMMGIDSFGAIINPPEAVILSIGRIRNTPDWQNSEWVLRRVVSATLSVDHRVADGADGARFLEDFQTALRDWELLL